jgi:hypothetical protein
MTGSVAGHDDDGTKWPSANNSIEINRLSMTRRSILRQNDASPQSHLRSSAFIGGSIFLGGPEGKRKILTADERRWSPNAGPFPGQACQVGFAVGYQRDDPGWALRVIIPTSWY